MSTPPAPTQSAPYPVQLAIEYPDRELDRVSTAFRLFTVIPIAIVLALIVGITGEPGTRAPRPT